MLYSKPIPIPFNTTPATLLLKSSTSSYNAIALHRRIVTQIPHKCLHSSHRQALSSHVNTSSIHHTHHLSAPLIPVSSSHHRLFGTIPHRDATPLLDATASGDIDKIDELL